MTRYDDDLPATPWSNSLRVCPPEWGLTPDEFMHLEAAKAGWKTVEPLLLSGLGFGVITGVGAYYNHVLTKASQGALLPPVVLVFSCLAAIVSLGWAGGLCVRAVAARRRLRVCGTDPSEHMIDLTDGTAEEQVHVRMALALADSADTVDERTRYLLSAWNLAVAARRAMNERLCLTSPVRSPRPTGHQGLGVVRSATDPRATPTAPRGTAARRWERAVDRYETVLDEWGAIASDPLSALDHAALLDVSQPRTSAFIDALGKAQDRYAVLGETTPTSAADIVEFEDLSRTVATAWTEAKRYAARVGYEWLPESERDHARKAAALLARAAAESATIFERAQAAEKAAAMLKHIHTVMLPEQSLAAIAATTRLAIEAATEAPGTDPLLTADRQADRA